jgi:hypothetical protein
VLPTQLLPGQPTRLSSVFVERPCANPFSSLFDIGVSMIRPELAFPSRNVARPHEPEGDLR